MWKVESRREGRGSRERSREGVFGVRRQENQDMRWREKKLCSKVWFGVSGVGVCMCLIDGEREGGVCHYDMSGL